MRRAPQRAKALLKPRRSSCTPRSRASTQHQVFDIARRVLGDLAAVSLEQRVCEVFIAALAGPSRARALDALGAALKAASDAEPALLRSAFALPPAAACGDPGGAGRSLRAADRR